MIYGVSRERDGVELVRFGSVDRAREWARGEVRDPDTGDFRTITGRRLYEMPALWSPSSSSLDELVAEIESRGWPYREPVRRLPWQPVPTVGDARHQLRPLPDGCPITGPRRGEDVRIRYVIQDGEGRIEVEVGSEEVNE